MDYLNQMLASFNRGRLASGGDCLENCGCYVLGGLIKWGRLFGELWLLCIGGSYKVGETVWRIVVAMYWGVL